MYASCGLVGSILVSKVLSSRENRLQFWFGLGRGNVVIDRTCSRLYGAWKFLVIGSEHVLDRIHLAIYRGAGMGF